jgi:hypothetical protein
MKMMLWSSETRTLGADGLHGVLVIGLVMLHVGMTRGQDMKDLSLPGAITEIAMDKAQRYKYHATWWPKAREASLSHRSMVTCIDAAR